MKNQKAKQAIPFDNLIDGLFNKSIKQNKEFRLRLLDGKKKSEQCKADYIKLRKEIFIPFFNNLLLQTKKKKIKAEYNSSKKERYWEVFHFEMAESDFELCINLQEDDNYENINLRLTLRYSFCLPTEIKRVISLKKFSRKMLEDFVAKGILKMNDDLTKKEPSISMDDI